MAMFPQHLEKIARELSTSRRVRSTIQRRNDHDIWPSPTWTHSDRRLFAIVVCLSWESANDTGFCFLGSVLTSRDQLVGRVGTSHGGPHRTEDHIARRTT
ncbi:hypothetical protein LSAT2_013980 [Lamellibrachia satsuma]|nr:hypothetical protein LSAT2_013980 [Lamellibrachia satsuma]